MYHLDLYKLLFETVSQGSAMPTEEAIQQAVVELNTQGYFYEERAVRRAVQRIQSADVEALLDLLQRVDGPHMQTLCHRLMNMRTKRGSAEFMPPYLDPTEIHRSMYPGAPLAALGIAKAEHGTGMICRKKLPVRWLEYEM